MEILLLSIGIFVIIATVAPFIPSDVWWIRGFDFPRLQVICLAIFPLIGIPIFMNNFTLYYWIFWGLLALCFFNQCYMIFPYTPVAGKQVESSRNRDKIHKISLLCANVLMTNRNSSKLSDIIKKYEPDIILAVETNEWWADQLEEFEENYPHVVRQPQANRYGMMLYSRFELIDPKVEFLVEDDIPSIHFRTTLQNGTEIEVHCLHPEPPFPTGSDTSSERDAELLVVGKDIKNRNFPAIVMGDMNDVAWSKTNYLFQNISGLLDPRVGRGFFNSFHAQYPFLRFPLDHFFHSNHFRLIDFKVLDYFGSDHFPVYIELSYEPDAESTQHEKEANESEKEEADEKIEKET